MLGRVFDLGLAGTLHVLYLDLDSVLYCTVRDLIYETQSSGERDVVPPIPAIDPPALMIQEREDQKFWPISQSC